MIKPLLVGVWRWSRRGLKAAGALALAYALFLLIGLIPLNGGFKQAEAGTAVYVANSSVHADFIVPLSAGGHDWREWFPERHFREDTRWATHVAIGWGDRGFYIETPTWADFKTTTALNALCLPSQSVLHAHCTTEPAVRESVHRIVLTGEQYRALCESILESVGRDAVGGAALIAGETYTGYDAFYEARGAYHCFYTCNSWVGARLSDAGVTTPLFTPLPGSPAWYLPDAEEH